MKVIELITKLNKENKHVSELDVWINSLPYQTFNLHLTNADIEDFLNILNEMVVCSQYFNEKEKLRVFI